MTAKFLFRDFRSYELRLLMLALVLAVAAITAVNFLTDRMNRALRIESNQLLGADLVIASDHPLAGEFADRAGSLGLAQTLTVGFPSMVMADAGNFVLADVKAVQAQYPLRGTLQISAKPEGAGEAIQGAPPRGYVWIEPRLGIELGVHPGQRLQLGTQYFTVAAYLRLEPDRGFNVFALAPRIMLNEADLGDTGLLQNGARLSYRFLVSGPPEAVEAFSAWATGQIGRGERIEQGGRQELRSALERGSRFFGLASLLTVILSATVLALTVRRYLLRQLDACALLRCLGASRRKIMGLYLLQFAIMGLVATLSGIVLGYLIHLGLHYLISGSMDIQLPAAGITPALYGFCLGFVLLFSFCVPPVLRLQQIPPLRVLRNDLGMPPLSIWAAYGFGFVALSAIIFWVARDPKLGGATLLAFVVALLVFILLARVILWGLSWLLRVARDRLGWRHGIVYLDRQAWSVSFQVVALSLGFMSLLLLTVVRGALLETWEGSIPARAPNRFVINIQPEQKEAVVAALQSMALQAELAPMIRGRLVSISGRPVNAAAFPEDERAQRLVEREFNLSWRQELPPGNEIESGQWFAAGDQDKAQASVEAGLAKTLGIRLGDELVFNIAGDWVTVRATSFRTLHWDSMRMNFFVLVPPGVLEQKPLSYLANFYLPQEQSGHLGRVLAEFPNLTVIDLDVILVQLKKALTQISAAVQFIFLLTLFSGILVLQGALQAAFSEKRQALVIMRALGASTKQLRSALVIELFTTGGLAGLFSALGAWVIGQILAWQLFNLVLVPPYWLVPVAVLLGGCLAVLASWFSFSRLLSARPVEVLRSV